MPLYDYKCKNRRCSNYGNVVEIERSMMDITGPPECDECGHEIYQVWSKPPAVAFKGSGFYSTDSRIKRESAKATVKPS